MISKSFQTQRRSAIALRDRERFPDWLKHLHSALHDSCEFISQTSVLLDDRVVDYRESSGCAVRELPLTPCFLPQQWWVPRFPLNKGYSGESW
mmetsp:Transcript_63279/g.130924  ORF Transcript_63279/g.130924 Transcript_63279/m.130924 type:complete len:93 (-) Transcript_63279:69-347(-)